MLTDHVCPFKFKSDSRLLNTRLNGSLLHPYFNFSSQDLGQAFESLGKHVVGPFWRDPTVGLMVLRSTMLYTSSRSVVGQLNTFQFMYILSQRFSEKSNIVNEIYTLEQYGEVSITDLLDTVVVKRRCNLRRDVRSFVFSFRPLCGGLALYGWMRGIRRIEERLLLQCVLWER